MGACRIESAISGRSPSTSPGGPRYHLEERLVGTRERRQQQQVVQHIRRDQFGVVENQHAMLGAVRCLHQRLEDRIDVVGA